MNTVTITDENFVNSEAYREFINNNPGNGTLMIRAYAAGGAIPISNLDITVSKIIDDYNVIFFKGATDNSGMLSNIILQAPLKMNNDLNVPLSTSYEITAVYGPNNLNLNYKVNIYDGVYVVQNIKIIPEISERKGEYNGR